MNLTEMTEKIEYFRLIEERKKINIDEMLKLSEIGSSIDTRFPEDATIRDDFYQSIIADDLDIRNSYEEADIDDFTPSEERDVDNINNLTNVTLINTFQKKITTNCLKRMGKVRSSLMICCVILMRIRF